MSVEIKAIRKELDEFKLQLDDISRKESELLNKKENIEIEWRKKKVKEKDGKNRDDLENLAKKQKTIKELAMFVVQLY